MAQEDRGLVIRGMLLFTGIGVLVLVVLAILFWRPQPPQAKHEMPPEFYIAAAAVPEGTFPAGISWASLYQMAETLPSDPGYDIRYNAAATLARRGSPDVPWDLIREMLDEKQQLRNNRVRQPDGRDIYDQAAARATMLVALRALTAWHEKRADKKDEPSTELRDIYAQVDRLAESPYVEMKEHAEKARATFFRAK
jgi:hypothetical protein